MHGIKDFSRKGPDPSPDKRTGNGGCADAGLQTQLFGKKP